MNNLHIPRVGLVAGEKSGDALGAGLIEQLKLQLPNAQFSGLGGPAMQAVGFHSMANMERLSVMGLIEPLKRLPDLLALRRELFQHFLQWGADIVVGIDSPDFNLGLERKLKKHGVLCCHYVCPSVWAWRQGRVKKIRRSVDYMLALLPFEQAFLQQHGIAASFVGHPLADLIDGTSQGIVNSTSDELTLCFMPGSRKSEVEQLGELQCQVARRLLNEYSNLRIVVPAASEDIRQLIVQIMGQQGLPSERIVVESCPLQQQSLNVMGSADVILLTSGTATLEAAMLGKPMVVVYRMAPLAYALVKRLVKVDYISLPNLLVNDALVPEYIQDQATVENVCQGIRKLLDSRSERERVSQALLALRKGLARNADLRAAQAVTDLLATRKS